MHTILININMPFVQRTSVKVEFNSLRLFFMSAIFLVADKLKPYSIKVWQYVIIFNTVAKMPYPDAPNILDTYGNVSSGKAVLKKRAK